MLWSWRFVGLKIKMDEENIRFFLWRFSMESASIKQEKADHINQAIISIDKNGTMVACNNAARHMFGFPIGKMIGSNVSAIMPAPFNALHASFVERYLQTRISHGAVGEWKG
jgi:PAS domain S-box-containing protein